MENRGSLTYITIMGEKVAEQGLNCLLISMLTVVSSILRTPLGGNK